MAKTWCGSTIWMPTVLHLSEFVTHNGRGITYMKHSLLRCGLRKVNTSNSSDLLLAGSVNDFARHDVNWIQKRSKKRK